MGTVSKEIADKIIDCGGLFEQDPPVYSVWQYTNAWGGESYWLSYHRGAVLESSDFVINPKQVWRSDDEEYYDEEYDDPMDGDAASALASAGFGTDEDYGDHPID